MGIIKVKYTAYQCDICYENITQRSESSNGEGEFPVIISGKQLHISGWLERLYNKPIVYLLNNHK